MNSMNHTLTLLVQQLTSRLAMWLVPTLATVIASAIAAVVAWLALNAPWLDVSAVDAVAIAAAVAGVVVSIIVGTLNALTNKLLKAGTAEMQKTLNKVLTLSDVPAAPLSEDGVAGVNTNRGAKAVVTTLLTLMGRK